MQEVMKDGSEGKLIVEDTLEDLLPHIRRSLDDPNVNFVKVFKGTKTAPSRSGKKPFQRKDTYAAEPNKGSHLDQLIEKRLKLQEASRLGLTVTDEELNQGIKETMGSHPKSEFVTFLAKEGTTFKEWKNGVRENILFEKLITSQVYLPIKVSGKEIAAYYRKHQDQFKKPKRFRIRQILMKGREEAEEILKALGKGEGFEELARKRSLSPDKERGGDMGYFSKEEMLAEWEEAVGKLSPGEVSYPVKSPYGWHIFKLEKVLSPRTMSLKEARKEIKEKLLIEKRERALKEWLSGLRVRTEIEINEEMLG